MCWPIGVKFCTVISSRLNFRGPSPKKFTGQKHAKFGVILDDFKVWWRISAERMKIFGIGQVHYLP